MAAIARANGGCRAPLLEMGSAPEFKGGPATISSANPHLISGEGGPVGYKFSNTGVENAIHALGWYTGAKERDTFYKHVIRPEGTLGGTRTIIRYYTTEGELMGSVELTTGSKLIFKNGAGTEVASTEVTTNKVFTTIEAKFWIHNTEKTLCKATFKVNGTQIFNNEGTYTVQKANPPNGHRFGWITGEATATIEFYDMGVNDSTGAANNTWLGHETVSSHSWAIEDKGREGVTAGGGGTTELFKATDAPPEGLANGSKTNTSQVFSATSSTTHFYEATIKSYTEIGVATGDTVNLIFGVSIVGNSSATVRSSGIKGISNPEITEVTENTSGTAGTYPSGWKIIKTAYVDNPTITKGTKPVLKWRKNVASTDAVASCFIAMFVEWKVSSAKTEEGEAKPTLSFAGAATGKLDPGFGVAACTLAFTISATGIKISQGSVPATLTFVTAVNTVITEFGQVAALIAFVATAQGIKITSTEDKATVGFAVSVEGEVIKGKEEEPKGLNDGYYRYWKDPSKYNKVF